MDQVEKCKTLLLTAYGGCDKLKVVEADKPKPKSGEILINVMASGINFDDVMMRQGWHCRPFKPPMVLGCEGSGEVVEVGEGVEGFKVGDRVMCLTDKGMWSEYAAVPEDQCYIMPKNMTYEEAAAMPKSYVTAYHTLFEMGSLKKGQSVLIHMVAGGVGNAATQLCQTVPGVTIYGTCSAAKHDVMRKAGVEYPVDYRTTDFEAEIRKIAPTGVDLVLDPLSGKDSAKSLKLLKPFGKIVHYGAANVVVGAQKSIWNAFKTFCNSQNYNTITMISSNNCMAGYSMENLEKNPELIRSAMHDVLELYRQDKIKPTIDSVWAFEDVSKAMGRIHDRKNIGKVIISPQASQGSEDIRLTID